MVDVRFARPEERAAVARFMARAFPRAKWGMDGWTALLDGRWAAPGSQTLSNTERFRSHFFRCLDN